MDKPCPTTAEHRAGKLLVPIDFSASSRSALDLAAALAARLGAEIELLHVVEPVEEAQDHELLMSVGSGPARPVSEVLRGNTRRALAKLALELHRATGVECQCRVELGVPHEIIITLSEDASYEYVVLGTRRSGSARWLVGSVAERVVRGAACPVLTVREPPEPAVAHSSAAAFPG